MSLISCKQFKQTVFELDTQEQCDCILIVDNEAIRAHKCILAKHSPVFEKMFYGKMASNEIQVTDIDSDALKQTFNYLYYKNLQIESVMNAWSLVYVASKYLIDSLLSACVEYLKSNLAISNLFLNYEHAELYNLEVFMNICWIDILKYASGIFLCDYHIKPETWLKLLDENDINMEEKDLIEQATDWAVKECDIREIKNTEENVFEILFNSGILRCFNHRNGRKVKNSSDFYHFRTLFKIYKNFRLLKSDCLTTVVSVNRRVTVFGIAVSTEHEPCDALEKTYTGGCTIEIYKLKGREKMFVDRVNQPNMVRKYDFVDYVRFSKVLVFENTVDYLISVRYNRVCNERTREVLCYYLGNLERGSVTFTFSNELNGSALRGIAFYPL